MPSIFSAAENRTVLKRCIMTKRASFCFICGWIPVGSNGLAAHRKPGRSPGRNTGGLWRGCLLTSQKRSGPCREKTSDAFVKNREFKYPFPAWKTTFHTVIPDRRSAIHNPLPPSKCPYTHSGGICEPHCFPL